MQTIRGRGGVRYHFILGAFCLAARLFAASPGSPTGRELDVYRPAVGFIGGCTATVVSPPDSEVTAVLFAAHCPGAAAFESANGIVNGFTCYQNRDFYAPERQIQRVNPKTGQVESQGLAGDDVGVCFSKQKVNTAKRGCLSTSKPTQNEELRFMGFGNPTVGLPPIDDLQGGRTRVQEIQSNGAIIAEGSNHVTPGDSGGPVVRIADEASAAQSPFFDIVGVNSKFVEVTIGGPGGFLQKINRSAFAPFTESTRAFFPRAMAKFASEQGGAQPKICGINFDPKKPAEPTNGPTPTPTTPPGDSHGENPPVAESRPRPIDNRPPALALGERLKLDFPPQLTDVQPFLKWLNELAQEDLKQKLAEVLRQPDSAEFRQFVDGLGAMPSTEVLARIRNAILRDVASSDGELGQPSSGMNEPWLKVLNDPGLALRRPDQALALLNHLRQLARKGDAAADDLSGLAARWAASLTGAQRKHAAELLEKFVPPTEGVPPAIRNADARILRFLKQAVAERPATDGSAARAQVEARGFAEKWNRTLKEAVPDPTNIDLNRPIKMYEKGEEATTVEGWIRKYVHDVGYDELVRWASSAGGETGRKLLALLARLGGPSGAPAFGVEVDRGQNIDVKPGPDRTQNFDSGAILRLNGSAGLDQQLRSLLPVPEHGWDKIHFVPSERLLNAPRPEVGFQAFQVPQPLLPNETGPLPGPFADHSQPPAVKWPFYEARTPTPTPTSLPQPITKPNGSGPTPTPTPTRFGPVSRDGGSAPPQSSQPPAADVPAPTITGPVAHALGKCVECHKGQADYVGTPEAIVARLGDMNETRFTDMLNRALKRDNSIDHAAMRSFYESVRAFHRANAERPSSSAPLSACYGTEASQKLRREQLPPIGVESSVAAARLQTARQSGHILFYDNDEVPDAFQVPDANDGTTSMGVADFLGATWRRGNGGFGYHDHANREWPWEKSVGTDLAKNVRTEHFIIPPSNGKLGEYESIADGPLLSGTSFLARDTHPFKIRFNTETTFGEQIQVKDPETGEFLTTEIRTRTKKPDGTWKMDVLRPFANPGEMGAAVRALVADKPEWRDDTRVKTFLDSMDHPRAVVADEDTYINRTAPANYPPRTMSKTAIDAINEKAAMHEIPDLPPAIVRAILKTAPFKSVFGIPWIEEGGVKGWAPTTRSEFSFVPKDYFGAFVPTTDAACIKCHQTAGAHVDAFNHPQHHGYPTLERETGVPEQNRTWYHRVKGQYGEGILSWNPGDAAQFKTLVQGISSSGSPNRRDVGPWRFNQCLANGLIGGLPKQ